MWDEITYPFPNFNSAMSELKLIHVSKKGPQDKMASMF